MIFVFIIVNVCSEFHLKSWFSLKFYNWCFFFIFFFIYYLFYIIVIIYYYILIYLIVKICKCNSLKWIIMNNYDKTFGIFYCIHNIFIYSCIRRCAYIHLKEKSNILITSINEILSFALIMSTMKVFLPILS